MSYVATASVTTPNASRYVRQLAKHWAHNLAVEESESGATITFPKDARGADWPGDARVTFSYADGQFDCRIEATAEGQRDGLKGAVERHIDRFAFREGNLTYDWKNHSG